MKEDQVKGKMGKDMVSLVKSARRAKLEEVIDDIKDAIISEYDEQLVDVVTDRRSKTNPNLYREEFIERLDEFEYLEESGDTLTLNIPDM